jgi:hypothetical protein
MDSKSGLQQQKIRNPMADLMSYLRSTAMCDGKTMWTWHVTWGANQQSYIYKRGLGMGLEKIAPENVEQVGYNQPHGNFANR